MLQDEIVRVTKRNNSRSSVLSRNIGIIHSYFGLGTIKNPTYDSVGREYGNISRERVRQIIERFFLNVARESDIPSARKIANIFATEPCWLVGDFRVAIEPYVDFGFDITGLLNLLTSMHYIDDVEIYYTDMVTKVSRECINDRSVIITKKEQSILKTVVRKLLTYPGRTGLFRFDVAYDHLKNKRYDSSLLYKLITNNDYCRIVHDHRDWYIIENRDNVIENTIAKIANITDNIRLDILCDALDAAIHIRTHQYPSPGKDIIAEYLKQSSYIDIKDNYAHINLKKGSLNQTDIDVITVYSNENVDTLDFPTLCEKIQLVRQERGEEPYSESRLGQLYKLPFIHKEGSESERRNYALCFITRYSRQGFVSLNKVNHSKLRSITSIDKIESNRLDEDLLREINELTIEPKSYELANEPKPKTAQERTSINTYRRSRTVALNALRHANFTCEVGGCKHKLFRRRNSKVNYTEPHHLVPISYSDSFEYSLDVEENIVSLCSNCHNRIHYGQGYEELLLQLFNAREKDLQRVGIEITLEELLQMYK